MHILLVAANFVRSSRLFHAIVLVLREQILSLKTLVGYALLLVSRDVLIKCTQFHNFQTTTNCVGVLFYLNKS